MNLTTGTLRELHRIHRQLSDLNDRLQRGPRVVKARETSVTQLEQQMEQAQADVKAGKVQADQKQLQLKTTEDKIIDLETKLNGAASNREYQALQDQIAADRMAGSVLQDEILECLERIDELEKLVEDAKANVNKGKEELEKVKGTVQEEAGVIKADIVRLEADLRTAEEGLPPDLKDAYNRIVNSKGADALAPVEGDCCGGCFQTVTPNMLNLLQLSKPVFCKSCGRLLYIPEGVAPSAEGE